MEQEHPPVEPESTSAEPAPLPRASWRRAAIPTLAGLFAFALSAGLAENDIRQEIAAESERLTAVAVEAAGLIDPALHAQIDSATHPAFAKVVALMREAVTRHKVTSPIYSLVKHGDGTRFVAMTNQTPFYGKPYALHAEMLPAFEPFRVGKSTMGGRSGTKLYEDEHGAWVSGYGGLMDGSAIVCADLPGEDLVDRRRQGWLLSALLGLLLALVLRLSPNLLARIGPIRRMRAFIASRLASRIGAASFLAVALASSAIVGLGYFQTESTVYETSHRRLRGIAAVAAEALDSRLHSKVRTADDAPFLSLRDELRRYRNRAEVSADIYTLRRDRGVMRFVVMTNSEPFVGHPLEIRPEMLAVLEDGKVRSTGPYSSARGRWISAWAPIFAGDGTVSALVEIDEEISALDARLRAQVWLLIQIALVGLAIALLITGVLTRGLTRPVRKMALAARLVGEGALEVDLPVGRGDELGSLARDLASMAKGLEERARLRDMFGKYMTPQVADRILELGPVGLSGELREITVIMTDIRGFTALTERLGAEQVVALINDHFRILVDVMAEFEGVVDKYMGDCLFGYFGAPLCQPDHRARALQASLVMQRRLDEWNQERAKDELAPVVAGIGIASGSAIVGNMGSPQRLEYTAIGDVVNLASRLCHEAKGGEIVVEAVFAPVEETAFERAGSLSLKGVAEPVPIYRFRSG